MGWSKIILFIIWVCENYAFQNVGLIFALFDGGGDEVLVLSPEMGLLGDSCKKVTNDCIALIHLNIYQMYLEMSNISTQFLHVFKSEPKNI